MIKPQKPLVHSRGPAAFHRMSGWAGQLAPQFGYRYGDDRLPVFEYYGYYKPERNAHEFSLFICACQKSLICHNSNGIFCDANRE